MNKIQIMFVFLFLVNTLFSQTNMIKHWGIQGGVLQSKLFHWKDPSGTYLFDPIKERIGFEVGVFSEVFKYRIFTFELELQYVRKAFSWKLIKTDEEGNQIETFDEIHKLNYLSLVVITQTRILEFYNYKLSILLGFRTDIFLNNRIYYSNGELSKNNWIKGGFAERINGYELGVRFEKKASNKFNVFTDLRYNVDYSSPFEHFLIDHNFRTIKVIFGVKRI